jgi:hypothetical protein
VGTLKETDATKDSDTENLMSELLTAQKSEGLGTFKDTNLTKDPDTENLTSELLTAQKSGGVHGHV